MNDLFKIKNIRTKKDKSQKAFYVVRDFDENGNSRHILLSVGEKNKIESLNSIKNNILIPLINKCKKLVGSFKHSEGLSRRFKLKQESFAQEKKTKLVQDVPTRWNSTLDMIESIILNEVVLKSMCLENENEIIVPNVPSEEEFKFLFEFYKLLKPMKELTVFLSGSKYVTTSILHPSIFNLINVTLDKFNFSNQNVSKIKDELKENLKKWFFYILNDSINDFFIMSTFLDYNYKRFEYVNNTSLEANLVRRAKATILGYYDKYFNKDKNDSGSPESMTLNVQDSQANSANIENESSTPILLGQSNKRLSRDICESGFMSTLKDRTNVESNNNNSQSSESELILEMEQYEKFDTK